MIAQRGERKWLLYLFISAVWITQSNAIMQKGDPYKINCQHREFNLIVLGKEVVWGKWIKHQFYSTYQCSSSSLLSWIPLMEWMGSSLSLGEKNCSAILSRGTVFQSFKIYSIYGSFYKSMSALPHHNILKQIFKNITWKKKSGFIYLTSFHTQNAEVCSSNAFTGDEEGPQ